MSALDPNKFQLYKKALNEAFKEINLPVVCLDIALDPYTMHNFFFMHGTKTGFKYKHTLNHNVNEAADAFGRGSVG